MKCSATGITPILNFPLFRIPWVERMHAAAGSPSFVTQASWPFGRSAIMLASDGM